MPILLSQELGDYSKRRAERFKSLQGKEVPKSMTEVQVSLVENVMSKAEASGLAWLCDGPRERAGTNKAPGPLQYFISSLAFCQLTHYAENAALMGLNLDEVKITARGRFNPLPGNGYDTIDFEARVKSSEPAERILELARRAEHECYVTNTLKKACKVSGRVFLNEEALPPEVVA